jgi:hypothetical protein
MKMTVVDGFRKKTIEEWANKHLKAGSDVVTDKLACFKVVTSAGCGHVSIKCEGNLDLLDSTDFQWVSTMIGNVKTALTGTCHSINPEHLPRYLAEFCFRFNHRFDLRRLLPILGEIMTRTPPMPNKYLKKAESYG